VICCIMKFVISLLFQMGTTSSALLGLSTSVLLTCKNITVKPTVFDRLMMIDTIALYFLGSHRTALLLRYVHQKLFLFVPQILYYSILPLQIAYAFHFILF
jgi:multisubunit Na+/H+ antiporter MnhF subunit